MSSNIFEALRQDHEVQRTLIRQLAETQGDSPDRRRLFEQLRHALQAHAAAEERCFYVPLIDSDLTQDKARHSVAEHNEIDELLAELEDMDMSSSGWLNRARHLFERVEHHLAEEEQEVFQLAGKALDESSKRSLAREYQREMEQQAQPA